MCTSYSLSPLFLSVDRVRYLQWIKENNRNLSELTLLFKSFDACTYDEKTPNKEVKTYNSVESGSGEANSLKNEETSAPNKAQ